MLFPPLDADAFETVDALPPPGELAALVEPEGDGVVGGAAPATGFVEACCVSVAVSFGCGIVGLDGLSIPGRTFSTLGGFGEAELLIGTACGWALLRTQFD